MQQLRAATHRRPSRFTSRWWLLPFAVVSFVVCPVALFPVFGLILGEPLWVKASFLGILLAHVYIVDRMLRKPANNNVERLESAQTALRQAPSNNQPAALLLRSFGFSAGYHDSYASFGIVELMEPTLRDTGFCPCALGTTLPLPPRHGVVMVDCDDETWWANFEALASQAAIIFVFPETSASLLREVVYLKAKGALQKTLLVMPPVSIPVLAWGGDPWWTSGGDDKAKRERWASTRNTWRAAFDVSLPEYSSRGALIELDEQGQLVKSTSLRHGEVPDDSTVGERDDPEVYAAHYRIPFHEIWQQILARRQFSGVPLNLVWRGLSLSPIQSSLVHHWRPPGDNGKLRHNVKMMCAIGWAPLLMVPILLLIAWFRDWAGW